MKSPKPKIKEETPYTDSILAKINAIIADIPLEPKGTNDFNFGEENMRKKILKEINEK